MYMSDYIDLLIDPSSQEIEVFDINEGETVFAGPADMYFDKFYDVEIDSIDSAFNNIVTLNYSELRN